MKSYFIILLFGCLFGTAAQLRTAEPGAFAQAVSACRSAVNGGKMSTCTDKLRTLNPGERQEVHADVCSVYTVNTRTLPFQAARCRETGRTIKGMTNQ